MMVGTRALCCVSDKTKTRIGCRLSLRKRRLDKDDGRNASSMLRVRQSQDANRVQAQLTEEKGLIKMMVGTRALFCVSDEPKTRIGCRLSLRKKKI